MTDEKKVKLTIQDVAERLKKRADKAPIKMRTTTKAGKEVIVSLPCFNTILVPIDQVQANNYNPNSVPENNMKLLEESIVNNGMCFPVVTIWDADLEKYVIVDGFHRYTIFKDYLKLKWLPIVVLKQNISQRMAATVQFNRARGVHQVEMMGDLVKSLIDQGVSEEDIATQLGMQMEEVYRLKQITGVAELFKKQLYSPAWEMKDMEENVYMKE